MTKLFRDIFSIIAAYGTGRFALVSLAMVAQALSQVAGVAAILPFFAAAADPTAFRSSGFGKLMVGAVGNVSDTRLIVLCGLFSLSMLVITNVLSIIGEYSRAVYSHNLAHWLRQRLMQRVLSNDYSYFLTRNTAIITKKIVQDAMVFAQQIVMPLLEAVTRLLIVIILSAWLLLVEPSIALVGAALLVFYYFCILRLVRARTSVISDGVKAAGRDAYFHVGQVFDGLKLIFASDSKNFFIGACETPSQKLSSLLPRVAMLSSVPRYLLETFIYGGLILWVIASVVSNRGFSQVVPSIGLVALVAYRLLPSLQLFFSQIVTIWAYRQSMEEILEEFDGGRIDADRIEADDNKAPAPIPWSHSIRLHDVCFRYAGSAGDVLHSITLEIKKGSHIAIVGPTGGGKSTLIDLLLGILEPTNGEILIDGVALTRENARAWRRLIGYMPQELFLLDASIAENIAFGLPAKDIDRGRLARAAERAQLMDLNGRDFPEGLETLIGERGVRLSGGQRQRLGIARALYREPSLLILDEATSALDNATERRVVKHLLSSRDKLTIVTIAHRLSTVIDCDCIYFMEQGRITARGDYHSLKANHRPFGELAALS